MISDDALATLVIQSDFPELDIVEQMCRILRLWVPQDRPVLAYSVSPVPGTPKAFSKIALSGLRFFGKEGKALHSSFLYPTSQLEISQK
jgi:hypothetical protein